MLRRVRQQIVGLACGLLFGVSGAPWGAAQATVSQASLSAELQSLAAAAQTIFVGQIVGIQRRGGVVEVSFRVEQSVTGAAGTVFTLREWAGLWAPEVQRYTVGQRVLAFVHGASRAGFSSPVHGAEGLVPVVVQGADAPRLLDVRRVAASVVRAPGTRLPDVTDGAISLDAAIALVGPLQHGNVQPTRVPLPVRGRPPVEFPKATRAARPVAVGDATVSGTMAPRQAAKVRP